jgi:transcriptional regulator with XRE-family HTH domain
MVEDREILNLVGARIKVLRKEKGLSQEALGEKGGFHFTYIGQVERGEKNVSLVNLAKIAEALEINISQLFAYVSDGIEFTETDLMIQEIVDMLREASSNKIRLSRNILRELLNESKGD